MGRDGPQSQGMGAGAGEWAGGVAMKVGAASLALSALKNLVLSIAPSYVYSTPTHGMCVPYRKKHCT